MLSLDIIRLELPVLYNHRNTIDSEIHFRHIKSSIPPPPCSRLSCTFTHFESILFTLCPIQSKRLYEQRFKEADEAEQAVGKKTYVNTSTHRQSEKV